MTPTTTTTAAIATTTVASTDPTSRHGRELGIIEPSLVTGATVDHTRNGRSRRPTRPRVPAATDGVRMFEDCPADGCPLALAVDRNDGASSANEVSPTRCGVGRWGRSVQHQHG